MSTQTNFCSLGPPPFIPQSISTVVVKSPLRVSFVGGGSDLPVTDDEKNALNTLGEAGPPFDGGRTISTAIDKYVWVFAKRRLDSRVIVHWREKEDVAEAGDLRHEIIKEILIREGVYNGVEIATFADIPGVGSGLGSSAATTCACIAAVLALKGYSLAAEELAESAADIELHRLKRNGGRQEHYATALGGLLDIRYGDANVDSWDRIPTAQGEKFRLSEWFPLFSLHDRSTGRNSDDILGDRDFGRTWRAECIELCENFVQAWKEKSFLKMSGLLRAHHIVKCNEFRSYIASAVRDELDDAAMSYKICGAGGTGHLLIAAEPQNRSHCVEKVEKVWGPELPWRSVDVGTEIIHAQ